MKKLNRLKHLGAYLSGPIDFANDKGHGWRDEITPFLEDMGVEVFNPLKHKYFGCEDFDSHKRPKMKDMATKGQFKELRDQMKDVNHWDLRSVDLSSFLVVNYDNSVHMAGTYEEIFKANNQCKPVLLVLSCRKSEISSWVLGRFPDEHMFESWEQLKKYLISINSNKDHDFTEADNKRWLFFSGDHIF